MPSNRTLLRFLRRQSTHPPHSAVCIDLGSQQEMMLDSYLTPISACICYLYSKALGRSGVRTLVKKHRRYSQVPKILFIPLVQLPEGLCRLSKLQTLNV